MNKSINNIQKLFNEDIYNMTNNFVNEISCADDVVYHYTSQYGLKGIIENKQLFFSNVRFLNDKTELKHTYNLLNEHISDFPIKNENLRNIVKDLTLSNCDIDVGKNIYVASFSHNSDSLSMWNYYTKSDENRGYNFHFLREKLYNNIDACTECNLCIGGNVLYEEEKQINILKNILLKIDCMHTNNIDSTEGDDLDLILKFTIKYFIRLFSIFMKNPCFSHEREFRLIIQYDNILDSIGKPDFRISKGIFIPYIKIPININSISGITLSPSENSTDALLGVSEFIKSKGLKNIKCNKSKIPIRY